MKRQLLAIYTRTSLHVGAGTSVGAIDQPVQRERHTGFPVIPGSAIKGVFADASPDWTQIVDKEMSEIQNGASVKYTVQIGERTDVGKWLFGEGSDTGASSGALQFSEAKILAFPLRSGRGGHAWITCPLALRRFSRDEGMPTGPDYIPAEEPTDEEAIWSGVILELGTAPASGIVLEDYSFKRMRRNEQDVSLPSALETKLKAFLPDDPVWNHLAGRLVILSDGMFGVFVRTACEVMQHNRIDDVTGTVADGALFNQENVPADTLFYSTVTARVSYRNGSAASPTATTQTADSAMEKLKVQLETMPVLQIGGDAGTGLGFCTVRLV